MNGNNAAHFYHDLKASGIVLFYVVSFFHSQAVFQHSAMFELKAFCVQKPAHYSNITATIGTLLSLSNVVM
jgi:hypothetical protein